MAIVTIKQVIAWLKIKSPGTTFFNSCIDKDLPECAGVYARRNGPVQPRAVGGASSYGIKPLTILVHWTGNSDTCEQKAIEILELFRAASAYETIGTCTGYFITLGDPTDVGRDEKGIFERTIDVNLIYRKG